MKYKITDEESFIVESFKSSRIPAIFKEDYIECMLFLELIDFDICTSLIKGEKISEEIVEMAIDGSKDYIALIDITRLDDISYNYYKQCILIIDIMKKYHQEHFCATINL